MEVPAVTPMPDRQSDYQQVEIQFTKDDDLEISEQIKEYQSRIIGTEVSSSDTIIMDRTKSHNIS